MCGDWWCGDPADWDRADPLDDPAAYAGVAIESAMLEQPSAAGVPPDLITQQIQTRRDRQAAGRPLWTIDLRPTGTAA